MKVCVPWYGDNPRRLEAAFVVSKRLVDDGFEPVSPAPELELDSPGAARNACRALVDGDVLVFVDADTIVPAEQLREAAAMAAAAPGLVYAYQLYLRLDEWATEQLRQKPGLDLFSLPIADQLIHNPSLGGFAISAECFDELGGFRDGFIGWGYEDCDFATRAAALWPLRRLVGPVWHLWHGDRDPETDAPDDSDPEQVRRNRELWLAGA